MTPINPLIISKSIANQIKRSIETNIFRISTQFMIKKHWFSIWNKAIYIEKTNILPAHSSGSLEKGVYISESILRL